MAHNFVKERITYVCDKCNSAYAITDVPGKEYTLCSADSLSVMQCSDKDLFPDCDKIYNNIIIKEIIE